MHKMQKRKEILKNSSEMIQRIATLRKKKEKKLVTPFFTSMI
jgi:hypothetical protein